MHVGYISGNEAMYGVTTRFFANITIHKSS